MKVLITICARGGSKGITKKNIQSLNGKPLIKYSIELAIKLKSHFNCKIAISTDDDEIINVISNDIETKYIRPKELANDDSNKIDAIKHLILYEENLIKDNYDYILDLDVSSPLRTLDDIIKSFDIIRKDSEMLSLFSVNKSSKNPYFNMVERNISDEYFSLVKKDKGNYNSRQSAPEVFSMNAAFYWYKRDFFDQNHISPVTERTGIFEIKHICFDIDTPLDFTFIEFLIKNNELDFKL